eukprot:2722463-Lingulodinium_polyedra.AAC.1
MPRGRVCPSVRAGPAQRQHLFPSICHGDSEAPVVFSGSGGDVLHNDHHHPGRVRRRAGVQSERAARSQRRC